MEYNFPAIGQRIKGLRKERGWSQDQLIDVLQDKVPIGRNTLSSIENGNAKHFELSLLTALCEVFDCEMGYILCEYDNCKTRDLQFIHDTTGLSEPAIKRLSEFEKKTVDGSAKATLINSMLEDEQFLTEAANILYALHMVPKKSIFEITFYDESNTPAKSSLVSDNSNDLRRLFMADLQNIIFTFLSTQFQK